MNKDLCDYQLIELLDIRSLLQTYPIEEIDKIFDAIAKKLFNEYHIKKGDSTYDFLEIEFYYFDKDHPDYITYPRTIGKGKWFFHNSGMDISFESLCVKGFNKKSEADNNFFGGILIRSLVKNGTDVITGPQKCTWELFDSFSAFEFCPDELAIIEHKPAGDKFDINKTNRWIPFNEEKAVIDYGKTNFNSFKEHHPKLYRYYIRHSIWEKFKTSDYNARPWDRQAKEIRL